MNTYYLMELIQEYTKYKNKIEKLDNFYKEFYEKNNTYLLKNYQVLQENNLLNKIDETSTLFDFENNEEAVEFILDIFSSDNFIEKQNLEKLVKKELKVKVNEAVKYFLSVANYFEKHVIMEKSKLYKEQFEITKEVILNLASYDFKILKFVEENKYYVSDNNNFLIEVTETGQISFVESFKKKDISDLKQVLEKSSINPFA
jgi:hypothetical protein